MHCVRAQAEILLRSEAEQKIAAGDRPRMAKRGGGDTPKIKNQIINHSFTREAASLAVRLASSYSGLTSATSMATNFSDFKICR